jgi:hypothetical protein
MTMQCRSFVLLAVTMFASAQSTQQRSAPDHKVWVADALKRMQTVQPGMTRAVLLTVFTTEGGISTRLHRTFVSRDCPYFKMDVEFGASAEPGRDDDARDVIVQISRPYLQFTIAD